MTTKEAMTHLVEALKADEAYRYSWQANIAVQFQDEWQRSCNDGGLPCTREHIHTISNKAADEFLKLLCRPTDDKPTTETNSIPQQAAP